MHIIMPFHLHTRVFGVVSCMNLHSTVYLVDHQFFEYICLIIKKENVKLGSYMWGLNFTMSCLIKMSLNLFKVEISSLPLRSPSDGTLCS